MNLSFLQEKILAHVIHLYNQYNRPLRASEIATTTDYNVSTIRNHMQILKMLGMIKGIAGPKGGYVPTSHAFKTLSIPHANDMTICLNNTKIKDGSIQIAGNVKNFSVGDTVIIRSTNNNTIIKGTITGMDLGNNNLSSPIEILTD